MLLVACTFDTQFIQNELTEEVGGKYDGPVGVDSTGDVGLEARQVVDDHAGLVTAGRQVRWVVKALRVRGGGGGAAG